MAKIEMRGLDEYTQAISRLQMAERDEVAGAAVYKGAGIVADAIQEGISSIPTDASYGTTERPKNGLSRLQKAALHESLGITKIRDDSGYLHVKVGFDGYNSIKTKRWPNGQPNAMIARAVERGTSWMESNKFIKKSVAKAKPQVLEEMRRVVDEKIESIMGSG